MVDREKIEIRAYLRSGGKLPMLSIFGRVRWLKAATIAAVATIILPLPGRGADRIVGRFPPFKDVVVSVNELERFANGGDFPRGNYADLVKKLPPAQLQEFRQILRQRFDLSPTYVSQLATAPLVVRLLERLGDSIRTTDRHNGGKSLQTALIRAARDERGLTILNVARQFPGRSIDLDLAEMFVLYDNLTELLKRRDRLIIELDRLSTATAANESIDFANRTDLRQAGGFRWQKRPFSWHDSSRQRLVPGDLYLPQTATANVPVIVISHGVAEDRTTYAYLAQHLASYGFGVAVIEHVGGDANRFRRYFAGLAPAPPASELLARPRDISFLLDEMQRRAQFDPSLQRLNLTQVGLIGHSLGGYTILALAGAQIDFDRVRRDCNPNRSLNLSVLLQCRANELTPQNYALQDPRIRAVFAINPLASTIFGKQGMSQIHIPTLLMGGSDDIVTPAVPEQIYPFTWLSAPNKYLAILDKGTHFSTQGGSKSNGVFPVPDDLIGPDPALARLYTQALTTAFFQTYLVNRSEFRAYLSAAYGKSLAPTTLSSSIDLAPTVTNRPPLRLNLVPATAAPDITQALQQDTTGAPKLAP